MQKILRVIIAAAIGLGATAVLAATASPTKPLSEADRVDVARIEGYLNGVKTMKARFLQVGAEGGYATGSIFLSRPGRMRVEYDPPTKMLIVATGVWLIYVDTELQQATYLPIDSTPAMFLLRPALQFDKDVSITGIERGAGVIRLALTDKNDPRSGQIVLTFSDRPLVLQKWAVTDAQGKVTNVALVDPVFGVPLPPTLFQYVDPSPDRRQRQ
jgi:outer membrane lipoprotein-sorting protein